MIIRTYLELKQLTTFEDRFNYLQLSDKVGADTFGFDRYLNQMFYKSKDWQQVRDYVICRDLGCDLGIEGYEIHAYDLSIKGYEIRASNVIIHHMNPITKQDIESRSDFLLDPEFLITTILSTHNAIHYGDKTKLKPRVILDRARNDTCPWKR